MDADGCPPAYADTGAESAVIIVGELAYLRTEHLASEIYMTTLRAIYVY